jgi:hypothetical protein
MNNLIKASLIRALWTACEVAVVTIGTNATFLSDVNWLMVLSACCLGFIVTFLKCLATGLPEVKYAEHIYMSAEEPDDAEVLEDDE